METLRKKIEDDLHNEKLTMYDEQIPASCLPDSVFEQEQNGFSQQLDSDTANSPGIFKIKYIPPRYDSTENYYSLFWKSYLDNEQKLNEIQELGAENFKNLNAIYNLEDYYENNLLPKMFSFPHQYLNRIAWTKQRRDKENERPDGGKSSSAKVIASKPRSGSKSPQKQQSQGSADGKSQPHPEQYDTDNRVLQDPKNDSRDEKSSEVSKDFNQLQLSKQYTHQAKNIKIGDECDTQLGLKLQQSVQPSMKKSNRKKHNRRTAKEIERSFICPYQSCQKVYGSEGSLNLHIKIKHNGGNKTDREKLAKSLIVAHMKGAIYSVIDAIDLNLPPGTISKAAKKFGLTGQVEQQVLEQIYQKLQNKQADAIERLRTKAGSNPTSGRNSVEPRFDLEAVMEMNSNINRATDNRQNAVDCLAVFQEMRDEEICQQTGVQIVPDEDGSLVSQFESGDEDGGEDPPES